MPGQTETPTPLAKQIDVAKIEVLKGLVSGALDQIIKAADVLCELIDDDEDIVDNLVEEHGFQRSFIKSLESVGRRQMRPELFFSDNPGHRALRKLSYSDQNRFLEKPIRVLVLKEDNTPDELLVQVENLTLDQSRQVFGPSGVRDPGAQRAYIDGLKTAHAAPKKSTVSYKVTKDKVSITEPCTLEAADLLNILQEMQRK